MRFECRIFFFRNVYDDAHGDFSYFIDVRSCVFVCVVWTEMQRYFKVTTERELIMAYFFPCKEEGRGHYWIELYCCSMLWNVSFISRQAAIAFIHWKLIIGMLKEMKQSASKKRLKNPCNDFIEFERKWVAHVRLSFAAFAWLPIMLLWICKLNDSHSVNGISLEPTGARILIATAFVASQ